MCEVNCGNESCSAVDMHGGQARLYYRYITGYVTGRGDVREVKGELLCKKTFCSYLFILIA